MTSSNKLLSGIAILALIPSAAWAQATPSPESPQVAIGEIIVTAQKRAQSINDVGVSVVAASGNDLRKVGVTDVTALTRIVPGLTFAPSLNSTPILTLRGVGFNDYTLGASPTVSVYTDQVPHPFPQMAKGATLDLERVEVLKGPQGILFGQNSTGGAINYIAAKPTNDFSGGINGSFGRFNETVIAGHVSVPLSETIKTRIAVQTTQAGPWQYNYTRDDKLGRQNMTQGRALVQWKPSSKTEITFNVNGYRDLSENPAAQLVGLRLQIPSNVARAAVIQAEPFAPANARAANWNPALNLAHDDTYVQASLRADFKMTPHMTLTSITSYDNYKEAFGYDRDGSALALAELEQATGHIKDYSHELRMAFNYDRAQWILGGNLFHADIGSSNRIGIRNATNGVVVGLPFGTATQFFDQQIDEYAAFANGEFKLFDRLTALGGVRYTNSRRDYAGCVTGDTNLSAGFTTLSTLFSGSVTPPIVPGQCMTLNSSFKPDLARFSLDQSNVSWKVGLNFKPANHQLIYVSVAKGYKAGSYPILSSSSASQLTPVSQEALTSYEAGFKLSLLNRTMQLNGAAFYYDYRDKQVRSSVVDPVFRNLERLVNVPKSRIMGLEADVTWRPTSRLTTNISATYLDATIRQFSGPNVFSIIQDYSGTPIPYTPKLQLAADAEYRFPIGSFEAFVGSHVNHSSSSNSTIGAPSLGYIRDNTVIDLRAGLAPNGNRWSLSVYGRNITNQYYWTNQYANQDVVARTAAKPVTYGVQFSYNF